MGWFEEHDPERGASAAVAAPMGAAPAPGASGGAAPASPDGSGRRHLWQYGAGGQGKFRTLKALFPQMGDAEVWGFLDHAREPDDAFMRAIIANLQANWAPGAASTAPAGGATAPAAYSGGPLDEAAFQQWLFSVTGDRLTTDQLAALEPEIKARGWSVRRNAEGRATKLVGPDGSIFDPIEDDDPGGKNRRQWMRASGPGGAALGGAPAEAGAQVGSLVEPWTVPFQYPSYEPPPAFQAPTLDDALADPSFRGVLDRGRQALERSAAAKGTLLTTGALQNLADWTMDTVGQQYGNFYGRKLGEYQLQGGLERGDYERDYNKALGEFRQGYDIFAANQDRPFNKLTTLAGLGSTAGHSLLNAGQGYAGQYGNTVMGGAANLANLWGAGANARASGMVGGANAWNQAIGNLANLGQFYAGLYANPWHRGFSQQGPYASGYRF